MTSRKVTITKWALALFNATTWIYMGLCAWAGWQLPENLFASYMTGNTVIAGAFVGGNMYEHKKKALSAQISNDQTK